MKNRFQSLGKVILVILSLFLGHSLHAQIQKGVDIDGENSNDYSGYSVSMPDANTVAIGAPYNDGNGSNSGHVRIYSWDGSSWTQKGVDIDGEASYDNSGHSVSMPDANTVAIGAPGNDGSSILNDEFGHVRIYKWNGNSWVQKGIDIDGHYEDRSGYSVSMPDSNTVAIGSLTDGYEWGHVDIYSWNGNNWIKKGITIVNENMYDRTGWSISMPDSNTIAVGATQNNGNGGVSGHVRIFSWDGSSWTQKGVDIDGEASGDNSGWSVSMPDANTVAIGAIANDGNGSNSGHVRIYSWDGSSWTQKGVDIDGEASVDNSGHSVSMPDANTVAIGAPYNDGIGSNSGHVRIYSWDGSSWTRRGLDIDGEYDSDQSGWSVSMPDANTLAIGALLNDGNGSGSGHVRIYSLEGLVDPSLTPYVTDTLGCIDCSQLTVGDYFLWQADTFLVANRTMLDSIIANGYDLSKVCVSHITDMSDLFNSVSNINGSIAEWDVSNVTDMSGLFMSSTGFNQDISNWDVSNVTDMSNMFFGAINFNTPLYQWDVSSVTSMNSMFAFTPSFNKGLGSWDVSSVTDMDNMFSFSTSFNQDLSQWCVSQFSYLPINFSINSALVTAHIPNWGSCKQPTIDSMGCIECENYSIGEWFVSDGDSLLVVNRPMLDSLVDISFDLKYVCTSYITDLDSLFKGSQVNGDIIKWDVSNVTSMYETFYGCTDFNQEIETWNVSNVENMSGLFRGASSFNSDISPWDVSALKNASRMFKLASSFNQDLMEWNVSGVTNMNSMFFGASAFNDSINSWDVSKVTDAGSMFLFASSFNQPLNTWDTYAMDDMSNMFYFANSFNQDLSGWCVGKHPSMPSNFASYATLDSAHFPIWGSCEIAPGVNLDGNGCLQCDSLNVGDFFTYNGDSIEVVDRSRLLQIVSEQGDLTKVCVSHVTDMKNVFTGAKWFNQDIANWDVSNVTNMVNMFFNADSFNVDISTWDVSNVTNMKFMFRGASSFDQNLNRWDVSQVSNMNRMFLLASSFNGNVSNWDVGNVTRMTEMFKDASSFNQDLSSWCVSSFQYGEPANFAANSALQSAHYPKWGNCSKSYDNVSTLAIGGFLNSNGCVDCSALNIGDYFKIGGDTLLVVDRTMLDSLVALAADLSKVCVSHITDMKDALRGLSWFNTDISSWDVSNVTDMSNMFFKARTFNQDIGNWDVSNVTKMARMFQVAKAFNQDIGSWDVSNVTRMPAMFRNADAFNKNIGDWDVSNVFNMSDMFRSADNFRKSLNEWCVPLIMSAPSGFSVNSNLASNMIPSWGNCPANIPYGILPNGCVACDSLNIGDQFSLNGNTYTVVDRPMLDSMLQYDHDITYACVSHITDFYSLNTGYGSNSLVGSVSHWDVGQATTMGNMFTGNFNQDIGSWDVSSVTDMGGMFYGNDDFNRDISDWDVGNVTNMSDMFGYTNFNRDIGNWDVSNVTNMRYMFEDNRSFNQNIGNWDVSNVTNMYAMFYNAQSFNQNLSAWCTPYNPSYSWELQDFYSGSNLSAYQLPNFGCGLSLMTDQTNNIINGQVAVENTNHTKAVEQSLTLYPNPTTGIIYLSPVIEGSFKLFNEIGRLIDEGKIEPSYDLSNLENGLYMLLLQTANESKYFKVIKQ